ncbi:MAG TPA: YbaY family lipoprotein, partial [Candidatus Limnocylindrales bacterium]|nr:YbaY family lipoprotein [Candidatus Limnocylindrales bacterium]
VLTYRPDLMKGNVTGAISGVDIDLTETAFSAAVVVDLDSDTQIGFDVNLDPVGVPIAFAVPFDPAKIDQSRDYVVTAAIFDASNRWTNPTGVPVITNGNPIAGITVPVSQPGAVTTSDGGGLGLLGTILALIGIAALIAAIVVFIRSRRPPTTPAPAGGGPDLAAGPASGEAPPGGSGPGAGPTG